MAFERGHKRVGGGFRKGKPNKITADLKAMILKALDEAGGVRYLTEQAEKNPSAFLTLLGKVLPITLTDPDGKIPTFNVNVRFGGPSQATAEHPRASEQPPAPRRPPLLN